MLQNFIERRRRRFTTRRSHGYSRPMHIVLRRIAIVSSENTDPCWYVCVFPTPHFSDSIYQNLQNYQCHICATMNLGQMLHFSLPQTTPFPKQQLNTYQLSRDALKIYLIHVNTAFSDSTKELSCLVLLAIELPCGKSAVVISLRDLSKAKTNAIESFPLS